MNCVSVISAFNTIGILIVKRVNPISIVLVKFADERGVFDNQQELCGCIMQTRCKSPLIRRAEASVFIVGKICIVGWIEKEKIVRSHVVQNCFEV